mmetsp:Transcript_26241/g.66617  ORF Transcript_26241/g.66617 Transcript_26241/m.66617 type:complete len:183 (+) Transcript_26241:1517-2065(+)
MAVSGSWWTPRTLRLRCPWRFASSHWTRRRATRSSRSSGARRSAGLSWQAYHSAMRIYVRNLGEEMWHGNNPNNSDLALLNKVYDWQNHTVRSYNKDDYYASSLTIDYQAWDEQDPDECDEELHKQYEGFFEDEVAKDRVCGRLAVHVLMCNGTSAIRRWSSRARGGTARAASSRRSSTRYA